VSTTRPPFSLISVLANLERHKIASGEPWLLLMDIEWPGSGLSSQIEAEAAGQLADLGLSAQHMRFVRNTDSVTFDANDGHGPQVYQPFSFQMGELKVGSDGSIPETEITASNVMRVLQTVIEQYAGIVGANLYLYALNTANPAGEPDLTLQFQVKQTVCNAKAVSIKCGASSPLRRLFPIFKFWPNSCMWQYKSGVGCTYAGTLPGCSKTIDGPNGCQVHFPGQVLPILAFPGIDTNGISAAGVV
jgi:hypothetical protein